MRPAWLLLLVLLAISILMFTRASKYLHDPAPSQRFDEEEDPWLDANFEEEQIFGEWGIAQDIDSDPSNDRIILGATSNVFASWSLSGSVRLIGSTSYTDSSGTQWTDFWAFLTNGAYKAGDIVPYQKNGDNQIQVIPGTEFNTSGSSKWSAAPPVEGFGVALISSTPTEAIVPCQNNNDRRGKSDLWKETNDGELVIDTQSPYDDDHWEFSGGEVVLSSV